MHNLKKRTTLDISRRLLAVLIALCMVLTSMPPVWAQYADAPPPYEYDDQDYEAEYEYECETDYEYNEYEYECEEYVYDYNEYEYSCQCDIYYECACEQECEYCIYYEMCEACILAIATPAVMPEPLLVAEFSNMPPTLVAGTHYVMWDFSTATTPGEAPYFRPSINANPLHPAQTTSIVPMGDDEFHSQNSTAFIGEYALRWDVDFPSGFDTNSGFGFASGEIPQNAAGQNPTSIGMWMRLDGIQMPALTRMLVGISTEPTVPPTGASFRGFTPTVSSETTWANAHPAPINHENWIWVEFPLNPSRWLNQGQAAQTGTAFTQTQQLYFPVAASVPGNSMASFLSFRHQSNQIIGGEGAFYISGLTFFYNYDYAGVPYFGFNGHHLFSSDTPAPPTVTVEWDGDSVPPLIEEHDPAMYPIVITITPGMYDIDWARSVITINGEDIVHSQTTTIEIDLYELDDDEDYILIVEIWNVAGFRAAVQTIAFRIDSDPDVADAALFAELAARVAFAQNRLNNATPVSATIQAGRHTQAHIDDFANAIANAQNILNTPALHLDAIIGAEIIAINNAINLFMSQIIEPVIQGTPAGGTAPRFGQRAEASNPYWYYIATGEDIPQRDSLRAAWITTAWNIDFPSTTARGTTPAHVDMQRAELRGIYEYLYTLGINAVIFQISPHGCVFFRSEMAPWSFFLTGVVGFMGELVDSQGNAWDPLEYAIQLAREFNMEFHAWFNPYRVGSTASGSAIHGSDAVRPIMTTPEAIERWPRNPWFLFGDEVRPGRDVYYVNPGLPEVRNWVVERILEVVQNYDIDVIHFDDYFYWAGSDTRDTFEQRNRLEYNTFSNQVFPNTAAGYDAWRREQTSLMVQDVSDAIRMYAPWVRFGISPAGVFSRGDGRTGAYGEPVGGIGAGIGSTAGGYFNYSNSMADTRTWVIRNLVDYITPQLYWSMIDNAAPFGPVADWWARLITDFGPGGQHVDGSPWGHTYTQLFAGLAPYRINRNDWGHNGPFGPQEAGLHAGGTAFGTNTAATQFEGTRQYLRLENYVLGNPAFSGSMLFTVRDMRGVGSSAMDALVDPNSAMAGSGSWRYPALVPAVPGLGAIAPRNPINVVHSGGYVQWLDGETSTNPLISTHYFVIFGSNTYPVDIYNPANILGTVVATDSGLPYTFPATTTYVVITAVNRLHHHSVPGYEPVELVTGIDVVTGDGTLLSSSPVVLVGPTIEFRSAVVGSNIRDINAVFTINGTIIDVTDRLMRRGTTDSEVPLALTYTFLPEHIGEMVTLTINANGASTSVLFELYAPTPPQILTIEEGEYLYTPGYQLPFALTVEVAPTYAVEWTVSGDLPLGISYIARGRFYLDFFGTPTQAGDFEITITATNAFGDYDQVTFTIVVDGPRAPVFITESELPSGALDLVYNRTIEVDTDYILTWTITEGYLPPGLDLVNGVVSGIPTQVGYFEFTIVVANPFTGSAEREFSIRIDAEPTPQTEPRAYMAFDFEGLTAPPFVRTNWQNVDHTEASTTQLVNRPSNNVFAGDTSLHWHVTSAGNLGASLSAADGPIQIPQRNGENPTGMGFWIKVDNMGTTGLNASGMTVTAANWPGITAPIRVGLLNGNQYMIWPGQMSRSANMANVWQWVEICFLTAQPLNAATMGTIDYNPSLPFSIPGQGTTNANSFLLFRQTGGSHTMDMNVFIDNITFMFDGATGADVNFGLEPPTVTYVHDEVNGVEGIILTIRDLRSGLDRPRLEVWLDGTNLVDPADDSIWASNHHITATIFIPETDFPQGGDSFTIEVIAFNNCGRATIKDVTIDLRDWAVNSVTVTPATTEVRQDGTRRFTASLTVTGTPPEYVTWSVSGHTGATISADGVLSVAADVPLGTLLTVAATSVFNNTVYGTATATVIEAFSLIEDTHFIVMGFDGNTPGYVPYFRDSVTGANSSTTSAGIVNVPPTDLFHQEVMYDFFGNRMFQWGLLYGRDGSSGIGYAYGQIPQVAGRNPTSIGVWMRTEDVYLDVFRMMLGVSITSGGADAAFRGFTPVSGVNSSPAITPDCGWVFVEFPLYTGAWVNQGQVWQSTTAFDYTTPLFFPNSQNGGVNVAGSFLSMRTFAASILGIGNLYLGGIVFFYNYCEETGNPVWENWGELLFPPVDIPCDECGEYPCACPEPIEINAIVWDMNATNVPSARHSLSALASPALHDVSIVPMADEESHSANSTAFLGNYAVRWGANWRDATTYDGNSGITIAPGERIPQDSEGRNPTSIGMWMRYEDLNQFGLVRMFIGVSTAPSSTDATWRGFTPTPMVPPAAWNNAQSGTINHDNWVFVEFPLNPARWLTQGQGATTGTAFSQTQALYFPNSATMGNANGTFLGFRHGANSITGDGAIYISGLTFFFNYDEAGVPNFDYIGYQFFDATPSPNFGQSQTILVASTGHLHWLATPTPPEVEITMDGEEVPFVVDTDDNHPIVITLSGSRADRVIITLNGAPVATEAGDGYFVITAAALAALPAGHYTLRVEAWNDAYGYGLGFRTVEVVAFFLDMDAPNPEITTVALGNAIYRLVYEYVVDVDAGGADVTWSVATGTLPAGLYLEPNTATSVRIAGIPTVYGDFTFTLRATNEHGAYGEREFTLTILPPAPPTFVSPTPDAGSLPHGVIGIHYHTFLGVESDYPVTWSISDGTLPTGLTLLPSPSLIAGFPTVIGTFTFTVRATNYGGYVERTFTVEITADPGDLPGETPLLTMDGLFIAPTAVATTSVGAGQANTNIIGSSVTGIPLFMRRGNTINGEQVWTDWILVEHCGVEAAVGAPTTMRRTPEGFWQVWTPVIPGLNTFEFFQPGVPLLTHNVMRPTALMGELELVYEEYAEFDAFDFEDIMPLVGADTMLSDGFFVRNGNHEDISWLYAGTPPLSPHNQNTGFGNASFRGLIGFYNDGRLLTLNVPTEPTFRTPHDPNNSIFQSVAWANGRLELRIHDHYDFNGIDLRRVDGRFEMFVQVRRQLSSNPERPFEGFTFVLDIGHGNSDPGALGPMGTTRSVEGYRWTENDINYANVHATRRLLESLGATVVVTGTIHDPAAGAAVLLGTRASQSQAVRPDAFMSFHADSLGNTQNMINTKGYTGWIRAENLNGSSAPQWGQLGPAHTRGVAAPFAIHMNEYLWEVVPGTTRGNPAPRNGIFGVINQSWTPAMLFEVGFMPNVEDFRWMIDPANQEIFAERLVDALLSFFPAAEYPIEVAEFGLHAFNNGVINNQSLAGGGNIRIWTRLGGANALVPYADLTVTAVLPNGNCAMHFVNINRPWNNQAYVNFIDANMHAPWQRIYLTATLGEQVVELTLINPRFFSLHAFNNGVINNQSLADSGVIRIWTQLMGANALVPYAGLTVAAVDQDGACAMEFVRINQPWANPGYVNLIDVNFNANWHTIYFAATVFGQTVELVLINPRPPVIPEFGLHAFNNGVINNQSLANAGIIRIWTRLDGANALVPDNLAVTAVDQDGECAMHHVRVNQPWANPGYVNLIDVNFHANWHRIYLTATVLGQTVTLELINPMPPVDLPEFSLNVFNNGVINNPSLAGAGLIRLWTRLDGVNTNVLIDEITAVDQDGECAMEHLRRINTVGVSPQGSFDVNFHAPWQRIYLTVTAYEQTLELTLINPM